MTSPTSEYTTAASIPRILDPISKSPSIVCGHNNLKVVKSKIDCLVMLVLTRDSEIGCPDARDRFWNVLGKYESHSRLSVGKWILTVKNWEIEQSYLSISWYDPLPVQFKVCLIINGHNQLMPPQAGIEKPAKPHRSSCTVMTVAAP
jgi:hypothetical protein